MRYDVKVLQRALNQKGFRSPDGKPLIVDGIPGYKTNFAIRAFKRKVGLRDRSYVGPITWAKLTGDLKPLERKVPKKSIPWIDEMMQFEGKHEDLHNAEVAAWLRSDGQTVGDPASVPWCGDAVETALRNTLDGIEVPENPYLAANWNRWGKKVKPQYGAIMVFWRGSPRSWKGHIGFYMGESTENYYILGGNQSNQVNIAPLSKYRLRDGGSRWPDHPDAPEAAGKKVLMTGGILSTNEA